jgi:hypothetical protein
MSDFDTLSTPDLGGDSSPMFPPIPGMKPDALKPLERSAANAKTMRELAAGREKNLTLQQADLARREEAARDKADTRMTGLQGDLKVAENDLATTPQPDPVPLPDPHIGEVVDKKNLSSAVFAIIGMSLIGAKGGRGNWKMAAAGIDGALKGYKEGSIVKYKEHLDTYKREYDQAIEKERESIKKYNDILKSKEYSINQKMSLINAQAAADGREELMFKAKRKDLTGVMTDIAKLRNNANALDEKATANYEKLVVAYEKLKEKRDADKAKADAKSAGGETDLENDPKTRRFMAEQYWAGDKSVLQNLGRGAQGSKNITALRKEIATVGAETGRNAKDLAAAQAEFQGMTAGERTLGTRTANAEMAVAEAQNMKKIVLDASEKFSRTAFMPVNTAWKAWQDNTGSTESRDFGASINSYINAYARAVSPTGTPTVSDKEHAREVLSAADSHKQIVSRMALLDKEMEAARKSPGQVKKAMREEFSGHGEAAPTGGVSVSNW